MRKGKSGSLSLENIPSLPGLSAPPKLGESGGSKPWNRKKKKNTSTGMQRNASILQYQPGHDDCLPEALEALSLDYLSTRDDVTRRDVLTHLMYKYRRDALGCVSLPITIMFFMLYSCSILLHEDITNVFLLESAVSNEISPGLDKISTILDVYEWMRGDFVDTFFQQEDLYGDLLPVELWSRVLIYSQVQGPVVLQQVRPTSDPWGLTIQSPTDNFTQSLQDENLGFVSVADEGDERRLLMLRPEFFRWFPDTATHETTYEVHLSPTVPVAEIKSTLEYLEQRHWIDQNTESFRVTTLLLNSELGRPRLVQLLISIYFGRGGNFFYRATMQSLFLEAWPPNSLCLIVDFFWICMLIGNSIWIVRQLYQATVDQRALHHLMSPWVILEWAITFWGWVNFAGFFVIYLVLMPSVRDELEQYSADTSVSTTKLTDMTDRCVWLAAQYRIFWSWYTLALMMRFFFAFRAHPRLAVVTRTLQSVGIDLLHFALVFFPTLGAYVVSGNILFGRRLEEFATLQASAATCIRIVFENEYEWESLSAEHFVTSACWVATFLIVVVIIMFNMVLAMILDIYREVRQSVDSSDTVFAFLRQLSANAINYRSWVSAKDVDGKFAGMDVSTAITRQSIEEMCPDWNKSQMDMLCRQSKNFMAFKLSNKADSRLLLKIAGAIRQGVDTTRSMVDDLCQDLREQDELDTYTEFSSQDAASSPNDATGVKDGTTLPERIPLLDPAHAKHAAEDDSDQQKPQWLVDLDADLDKHDQWLAIVQKELHKLQLEWHQSNQNISADEESEADSSPLSRQRKRQGLWSRSRSLIANDEPMAPSRSWWGAIRRSPQTPQIPKQHRGRRPALERSLRH